MKIKSSFFKQNDSINYFFEHGNFLEKLLRKDDYLTLCIKNNGASVAIIDINRTVVELQYKLGDTINQNGTNFKKGPTNANGGSNY